MGRERKGYIGCYRDIALAAPNDGELNGKTSNIKKKPGLPKDLMSRY